MIINDFNARWAGLSPFKTNPILIVDPDAMLTGTFGF